MPTPDQDAVAFGTWAMPSVRTSEFGWLCVHSHVSLRPTRSESAHCRLG